MIPRRGTIQNKEVVLTVGLIALIPGGGTTTF